MDKYIKSYYILESAAGHCTPIYQIGLNIELTNRVKYRANKTYFCN